MWYMQVKENKCVDLLENKLCEPTLAGPKTFPLGTMWDICQHLNRLKIYPLWNQI